MKSSTHLAFAGLTGIVASGFGSDVGIAQYSVLAVGALLPDFDTQNSGFGRMIKPVSGAIERRFGHRTITHSLLGLLLVSILFSPLLLLSGNVWQWLLWGYATHLLLDTANITGVPLFYPNRLQFWTFHNRDWRVPYGSPKEFVWLSVICVMALVLMPLSINGFSPWFHRALGSVYGAVEDYQLWQNDYEVIAEVDGYNLITNEKVIDDFRVIDALGKELLLVEDITGKAFSVGLDDTASIQVRRVRIRKGQPLQRSSYRVDLTGRLVSDLLNSLPPANRVQMNAILEVNNAPSPPLLLGEYQRVKRSGSSLEVRAATQGDLAPYSHLLIKSGSAMIFAEYSPETDVIATEPQHSAPPLSSHVLTVAGLPSLSGLLVQQGQEVTEGEYIARYIDDSKLELSNLDKQSAVDEITSLQKSLELEQDSYELVLQQQKEQIENQVKEVERLDYLVLNGAEPKNKLTNAQNQLKEMQNNEIMLKTDWTSRKHGLESSLNGARVRLAKTENIQGAELSGQWVTAPVSGIVSDVRIAGSSKNGIDLAITILETEAVENVPTLAALE